MFKKSFSFEGRIRRLEYGITNIIIFVVALTIELIIIEIGETQELQIMNWLLNIPIYWFIFAQGAKRCHDLGKSGWWQIIPFYIFALLFQDGDRMRNEYGLNPKYPDQGGDVIESETLDGYLKS
jgi:uncharacterized membrane protein YhaH (DUF805 family)